MDPIPKWFQRFWDAWNFRLLILSSLVIQVTLILLGGRRKYINRYWIFGIVWPAYLLADSVATSSLSMMTDISSDETCPHPFTPLWATLFLLHLGGPDTITAYAVEDIGLWLRHLFALVTNVAIVIYILLRCWPTSQWVAILNSLMFVAGFIKYGERTWALYLASKMFPQPFLPIHYPPSHPIHGIVSQVIPNERLITIGYIWLQEVRAAVFASLDIGKVDGVVLGQILMLGKGSSQVMFEFVEIVLGFVYDALYTKAPRIYTRVGGIARSTILMILVSVLIGFSVVSKDYHYQEVDIFITYFLLVGALVLEAFAIMSMISSDWMIVQMNRRKGSMIVKLYRIIYSLVPLFTQKKIRRRCSTVVPQLNLLDLYLCGQAGASKRVYQIFQVIHVKEYWDEYLCRRYVNKPEGLEELIIKGIQRVTENEQRYGDREPLRERGEYALRHHRVSHGTALKASLETSFDDCILIWHLVTTYLYEDKAEKEPDPDTDTDTNSLAENCRFMSDYMMHLLITPPYMLNAQGGGKKEYLFVEAASSVNVTKEEKKKIVKTWLHAMDKKHSAELENPVENPEIWSYSMEEKKRRYMSGEDAEISEEDLKHIFFLFNKKICVAEYLLVSLMKDYGDDKNKKKWEMISDVWVDMLLYGAAHSQVTHHMEKLVLGGELLTHVWLLATMHGLTNANRCVDGSFGKVAKEIMNLPYLEEP